METVVNKKALYVGIKLDSTLLGNQFRPLQVLACYPEHLPEFLGLGNQITAKLVRGYLVLTISTNNTDVMLDNLLNFLGWFGIEPVSNDESGPPALIVQKAKKGEVDLVTAGIEQSYSRLTKEELQAMAFKHIGRVRSSSLNGNRRTGVIGLKIQVVQI